MCTIAFGKFLSEKQFIASILLACIFMAVRDLTLSEFYIESFYVGGLVSFLSIIIFVVMNNVKRKFLLKAAC